MVDNGASQVQKNVTFWHGLFTEQLSRAESYGAEVGKMQKHGMAQAKLAADESAKLYGAWMDYGLQLGQDFQKLAMQGARRGLELLRQEG